MAGMTLNIDGIFSLRDAVGACLESLGEKYPNMITVSADVDVSSRIAQFKKRWPERCFNVGIAEQNLMSWAAGMAHEGFIPFAFSFAPFASMRACEQVRTDICYANLPVRIVCNYAGYSGGESGITHCAVEDVAIMTSFPNMTVIEPGDPFQIAKVLEAAMELPGPVYIRMGREATASLYAENQEYKIGKALIPKGGNDGAFICSGITVHHAMEAAKIVKEKTGAEIRVVDMHTIKPLDKEAVFEAAKTGRIVCAQDHNIIGGLGFHVANTLAEAGIGCRFKILGCPDEFFPLATADFLYHMCEIDAEGMAENMIKMLA